MERAKGLFASSSAANELKLYEDRYEEALEIVAKRKKKPELIDLDKYLHGQLVEDVQARSPPHLEHKELSTIMKWKLTKGKMRPLQKLVDGNSPKAVQDNSNAALTELLEGNIDEAFEEITKLRGIGVATASAVFALFSPQSCPFMSDEVIEIVCDSREYTMPYYKKLQKELMKKATDLGDGWTAERIGKALWACVVIESAAQEDRNRDEEPTKPKPAPKRRKMN